MIYEYECKLCKLIDDSKVKGCRFQVNQSIKDEPLKKCGEYCLVPHYDGCNHMETWKHDLSGKGSVKRVITGGSGFMLKGSGFYINDYKKENK